MLKNIELVGASENNLKNIDLTIPRNKIVCFIGVSGSGKSTIAFDIIAKEGQRQYFESLSSLARRYLSKSNRPEVDYIRGLSSTIVINQDRVHASPRSTVGTITEIYTYLRLLYARCGYPIYDSSYFSFNHPLGACSRCKGLGRAMEVNLNSLVDFEKSLNEGAIIYSNWRVGSMAWKIIKSTGYFDMDKKIKDYCESDREKLLYGKKEVVPSNGESVINWTYKGIVTHLLSRGSSTFRTVSTDEMKYFKSIPCPECLGERLKKTSLEVTIDGVNIGLAANMPVIDLLKFIKSINHKNAQVIKPRIVDQLQFLIDAGVGYLSLNRSSDTLSGGEAQRIKLARQLGCDLTETIYVLDEPTAGLHPKDVELVIKNLKKLRDSGNSVLVVEHDESVIRSADYIVEIGPGGGREGGEVVFAGSQNEFLKSSSPTAKHIKSAEFRRQSAEKESVEWIAGGTKIQRYKDSKKNDFGSMILSVKSSAKSDSREAISGLRLADSDYLKVVNAYRNNLKNISVNIPRGKLVVLTGVSGSGKSSLVEEIVAQHKDEVIEISQKAIGNNKRGCIATYVGVFDEIRTLFAKENKVSASKFSYNSKAGQCDECKGLGFIDMDMNFLGDVRMKCEKCKTKRYKKEVLKYKNKDKSIYDVLNMTAKEASLYFDNEIVKTGLEMLLSTGLDYIELGQTLDTLSGGEAQRLKLAKKLQKKGDFYILDEPTSGLHFFDIKKLMTLLRKIINNGNSILVIEHNLNVIRQADWVIDLGPEGGEKGGEVLYEGPVEGLKNCKMSWTGKYI